MPHSDHVLCATFQITRYIGHIIYASHHQISRRTTFHTRRCTAFHMLASVHHSRSDRDQSHPAIPHPTIDRDHIHRQFHIPQLTMFRIKFHITQYTTTFYTPPLTHTTPCHSPHSTSFHITQRLHSGHSAAHVPIHITPPLSITPFQFQRLGTMMWSVLLFHSYMQPFVPHIEPKQKWWWKSATLFRQKVPVCPNTILFHGSFLKLNHNITHKLNGWSEPAVLGENDRCFSSSSFFSSAPSPGVSDWHASRSRAQTVEPSASELGT